MSLTPEAYAAVAARAELLISGEEVERALDRMAREISRDLGASDPLVLCLMTGAVIVAGRLLPRLDFQLRLGYLHATRYQGATRGGDLAWVHRPSADIRDRHILLVDDILDEGLTLEAAVQACRDDGAASVRCAVLVEKDRARNSTLRPDYVGIRTPDRYLYGYGLDYRNYFRNAAGIYAVAEEDAG